jgi:hypothetical protein
LLPEVWFGCYGLTSLERSNAVKSFIQHHASSVMGVLNGFDRLRFRGTLRWLCYAGGLGRYLSAIGVRLSRFKEFSQAVTGQVRESIEGVAKAAGRPIEYLAKPSVSKEAYAQAIAERDGIREGLIGVLYAVEPCRSFRITVDKTTGFLEVENALRKCTHYYSYWMDPVWGFCHVRVQAWLPMTVHVYINGREWLARQLDRAGIGYRRRDNCFVWVQDVDRAQTLLDRQLQTEWGRSLDRLLHRSHPDYRRILDLPKTLGYYWTVDQSEWASDVMFRSAELLRSLYPQLIAHGMQAMGSREVLRFLGRVVPAHGGVRGNFQGEVTSDLRERPEGMRIKHRVKANTIKMYDKQGSVLRVETTINDTQDFQVFRAKEGEPRGGKKWLPLRKGVADLHRRAVISQAANTRYLESMAAVEVKRSLGQLMQRLCRPVRWKGQRVRALNPLAETDGRLLEVVNRGEFAVNGFRNRDLRDRLCARTSDSAILKKQSAAITRQLRLLRAHGLIRKLGPTHRYALSKRGREAITALLVARAADASKLVGSAA